MPIAITDNEATAARRRVPLLIYADTAGAAWAGSVTGVKAQISVNGGSETASTADIVRVAGSAHYIELTQAETNRTPGDRLSLRVAATGGRLEAISFIEITADDVFSAAATDATIVSAMRVEETISAWGSLAVPVGGSSKTYPVLKSGTSIGTRTAYFDSTGICVGMTVVL